MFTSITDGFKRGIKRIRENPQLAYSIFVAIIIFFGFVLVAQRFASIALQAQEQLINVRVGSIQDTFAQFAAERINDPAYLETKIQAIQNSNQTIQDFRIIAPEAQGDTIIASLNQSEIGQIDTQDEFLFRIAAADPAHSFTQEYTDGAPYYKTIRALVGTSSAIVGYSYTSQSLSQADQAVNTDIRNSIIIFVIVILLVMFLFFRHSKIIDYTALYKQLEGIDKMKDDFVAMTSHEFRTPLTIIRGYAENLEYAPGLDETSRRYVKNISTASHDLALLVDDILDVSRLEQGRMKFDMKEIDADQAIKAVADSLTETATKKGLTLDAELGSGKIMADPDKFRQIMINLIGNAVKYTEKGGVKVKTSAENGNVKIVVSDTGIGISGEEIKKLFQKFYRVSNEQTSKISGTGLGLWISAEMVKRMNGTVEVESIEGVGSHFVLTFPEL